MLIPCVPDIKSSEVTDYKVYVNRRSFYCRVARLVRLWDWARRLVKRRRDMAVGVEIGVVVRRALILFAVVWIGLLGWIAWPASGQELRPGRPAPDIAGGPWINSPPLTMNSLRGRVVLVEFWTYG